MSINERIRRIMHEEKLSAKALAAMLKIGESRLSQKFKEEIWDSVEELKRLSDGTGYELDWLVTGKGPARKGVASEPGMEWTPSQINRGEFYQELVETNSDYRLIPKSIIEGDYRIILKSELDEMNRTRDLIIQAKDQTIALMERRISDLERLAAKAEGVKK